MSPPQGNNGGTGAPGNTNSGAGGGGAGAVGSNSPGPNVGGTGGIGSFISDSAFGPTAPSYGSPVQFLVQDILPEVEAVHQTDHLHQEVIWRSRWWWRRWNRRKSRRT